MRQSGSALRKLIRSVAAAGLWTDGVGKDQVRDGSGRNQSGTGPGLIWEKPLIGPGDVPALTLGQLEGSYPAYCKAMSILIREGKTLHQIQRTMCWHRLVMLNELMPSQYRDP